MSGERQWCVTRSSQASFFARDGASVCRLGPRYGLWRTASDAMTTSHLPARPDSASGAVPHRSHCASGVRPAASSALTLRLARRSGSTRRSPSVTISRAGEGRHCCKTDEHRPSPPPSSITRLRTGGRRARSSRDPTGTRTLQRTGTSGTKGRSWGQRATPTWPTRRTERRCTASSNRRRCRRRRPRPPRRHPARRTRRRPFRRSCRRRSRRRAAQSPQSGH